MQIILKTIVEKDVNTVFNIKKHLDRKYFEHKFKNL